MTQTTAKRVATLIEITRKNMHRVKGEGPESPFASSAAKYYPALKKLASK